MYYKILNADLKHRGMKYHEGLNVDIKEFDNGKEGNGLYFADINIIIDYFPNGPTANTILIADVTLPDKELVVECDPGRYKAHQIILSNIRSLWECDTIKNLIAEGLDTKSYMFDLVQVEAVKQGRVDLIEYLHDMNLDILYGFNLAAQYGHMNIVKYYVGLGNYTDHYDKVLHYAASYGHLHIVKYLAEHGANIDSFRNFNINHALKKKRLFMVEYLVDKGIKFDDWAVNHVVRKGFLKTFKFFVEHGADISCISKRTIVIALIKGHFKIVFYLFSEGRNLRKSEKLRCAVWK